MNNHAEEDAEANLFALELLMPEQFVRSEIKKMKSFDLCDDEAMKKLARIFQVPQSIMAVRVGQIIGRGTISGR